MKYTIENNYLKAIISDLGATLVSFIDIESGVDMVLGYEKDEDYIENFADYFGCIVGRNANRIKDGKFVLNDVEYQLSINDGPNNLHGGGLNGFSYKRWTLEEINSNSITFSYFSKDKEEGFPGNLKTIVKYELKDNNLLISFSGTCDQDTLFNITAHSYFNFGDKDILNHSLLINTDKYSPTTDNALTLDEVLDVKDTPYDFSSPRIIKDNLLKLENGIDNNYVWETINDKHMCQLSYNNLQLNIYSDLPDLHVYTGDFLSNRHGKDNKIYDKNAGIALECQYYPNGINYNNKYLLPILRKDETMSHYIRYEIKKI